MALFSLVAVILQQKMTMSPGLESQKALYDTNVDMSKLYALEWDKIAEIQFGTP